MPGSWDSSDTMLANMSRWGVTTLRNETRVRFIVNNSPSWASVGRRRMASSSSSIRSSKQASTGKKLSTSWSTTR